MESGKKEIKAKHIRQVKFLALMERPEVCQMQSKNKGAKEVSSPREFTDEQSNHNFHTPLDFLLIFFQL